MITEASPKTIAALIERLPEFEYKDSPEDIFIRIDGKDGRCFVVEEEQEYLGFLVAYSPAKNIYYNWLTGVLPEFRGNQYGLQLFRHFEEYAWNSGYRVCRVKTMNHFRNMLSLLIRLNYNIVGMDGDRIKFEKTAEK